ncbi:metallophosphatase [Bacteroidia bacterium]|nr:metallophosphatase [Bacteroidia bacterium]
MGNLSAADFRFNGNGKFKIVQVTDSHIKADSEHSQSTIAMLNQVLDAEQPDLVFFTGDVVTGKPYKAGLDMILAPVISRKIPWALVFGNHDAEQDLSYEQLSELVQNEPLNVGNMKKLKNVSGYGNYTLEIKDKTGRKTAFVLYALDTHQYSTQKPAVGGYGWVHFDQIRWYQERSDKYTRANAGTPLPALAFFHIPLLEYRAVYLEKGRQITGVQQEAVCSPEINTGLFTAMLEKGDVMGTFVGHDHVNDYIFNYHGIALAYGRWSGSKTTYGDLKNGVRVIEVTEGAKSFDTWVRLNDEVVIDKVKFPDDFPLPEKKN